MIIGLVGPDPQDTQLVSSLLLDNGIETVDGTSVIRGMSRYSINSIISKDYHKQYFVKQLESEIDVVAISSNLIFNQDICEWLLRSGNIVCMVYRDNLDSYDLGILFEQETYWGNQDIQQYEMVDRFNLMYDNLSKVGGKLYRVDLSDDDSEDLVDMVELLPSIGVSKIKNLSNEDAIDIVTRKEDPMNIEESIKKAMLELGVDLDETIQTPEPVKKKASKPVKAEQTKLTIQEDTSTNADNTTEVDEIEVESSVFVKISNGTMALMIPSGVELSKEVIGGVEFKVATVKIPDINSNSLQQLPLSMRDDTTPTTTPKPKPEPGVQHVNAVSVESDLQSLVKEKARLDAEIKRYRAAGDDDMVNSLRKQRRSVRKQINNLK